VYSTVLVTSSLDCDAVSGCDRGDTIICVSPNYYRPTEVDLLLGNATKAENILGWKAKTQFKDLVKIMVKSDLQQLIPK